MKTTQPNHPLQAECSRAANDWDKLLTPKTTHTPGPWQVVTDSADRSVIKANADTKPVSVIVADSWVKPSDARLIAAAPDLLAALQELIEFAEPVLQNHGFGYMGKFEKARAAIAKATG